MGPKGRPVLANRDVQAADLALLYSAKSRTDVSDWRSRISKGRPVYSCPKCWESAMQFFTEHASHPDRSEFFHCHACGTYWEM